MACYKYLGSKNFSSDSLIRFEKRKRDISIIFPTYNEERNVGRLIQALKSELEGENFEIIVVDDDSKDKTPQLMDDNAGERVIALHRFGKRGIFSAFLDGIKISNGEYIVIMDADFSHPPKLIKEFLKYKGDYDIVSGSRFLKGAGIEAPFFRKYGTTLLNKVCNFIMGIKVKDATGGFHLIRKSKFEELKFKYSTIWGEFDLELFYRAVKKGFKIKEVPFVYKFRLEGHSKSENLLKYAYVYVKRAIQLRFFS
ncbi:MAG: glycosyltransferase [Nanoarchaeota archaeon]|nr:glycosyltransferase [Nanoarchaeota archaeon]MBU1005605.1 glycosyltransferase [Nanoarchaeota archaeon]MBU1945991.1 glycosyltransferase [Nanoarchaeota archaeon]